MNEFNKNKLLTESLEKLKANIINPRIIIQKKLKTHKKTTKHKHKLKTKKRKLHKGGNPIDKKDKLIIEEEKEKFGTFLDQISLKTETGILPKFRIFENHDENIMACIFYGFYMRLAVNYYNSKYSEC
jgi:hypothetical protein